MADYSYIGVGRIYLKEVGASAGLIEVGNCSELNFSVTEDTRELRDYTQPGGGTYNEVRRISAVEVSINMHDLSPANLARALYGSTEAVTSATVTGEEQTAYIGAFVKTDSMPSEITKVTDEDGVDTYVEGEDYEVRPGGIFILEGGAISDGETILIDYTSANADVVQALVDSGKEYEMVFDGLNEARSGKKTIVHAYRIKLGALADLALIGDEYAAAQVTGKVLKDSTKTGAGISQYFKVEIER